MPIQDAIEPYSTKKKSLRRLATVSVAVVVLVLASIGAFRVVEWAASSNESSISATVDPRGQDAPPSLLYVNEDTGRITKMVSSDGTEVFNEGFASTDTEVESIEASYFSDQLSIERTIEVEGKQYPISASLYWQYAPQETSTLISFYNEHVAAQGLVAYDSETPPNETRKASLSLREAIHTYIRGEVKKALNEGTVPAAEFVLNGESFTHKDSRVAEASATGASAQDAYSKIHSQVTLVPGAEYAYSVSCTTMGVASNFDAMTDAFDALFPAVQVDFTGMLNSTNISVDTIEPCDVFTNTTYDKNPTNDVGPPPGVNPPMSPGDSAPSCDISSCSKNPSVMDEPEGVSTLNGF